MYIERETGRERVLEGGTWDASAYWMDSRPQRWSCSSNDFTACGSPCSKNLPRERVRKVRQQAWRERPHEVMKANIIMRQLLIIAQETRQKSAIDNVTVRSANCYVTK